MSSFWLRWLNFGRYFQFASQTFFNLNKMKCWWTVISNILLRVGPNWKCLPISSHLYAQHSHGFTEFWDHIWEADSFYCTKYFNNVGNFLFVLATHFFSLWQSFSLASRNVICKKKAAVKSWLVILCFVTKQFQRVLLAP